MRNIFSFLVAMLFFGLAGTAAAQNLVSNPSFETRSGCPGNWGQLTLAAPWSTATDGTPDYYSSCYSGGNNGWGVPSNYLGNQAAHSGNAYAGFIAETPLSFIFGQFNEYIQAPLTSPLVAGRSYKVSFWVSLADRSLYGTDGIGAYFANGPVSQTYILTQTPQVRNAGNVVVDYTGWTLVQGTFVATGGENYIVIGQFGTGAATANSGATNTGDSSATVPLHLAYYYIDDVSVEPQTVDLSIEKTILPDADPLDASFSFQLTVKSPGDAFNGHLLIAVNDSAPPGMTFTGVTASLPTDWTCPWTPATVSCVYVGTGPTTSNQTIGTINVTASATALPLPPLTWNCATVALAGASGLTDVAAPNNKACVLLTRTERCRPPLVPGPLPGQCVCPKGTRLRGTECVTVCPPPKVPGRVLGVCVCPPGTVQLPNGSCGSRETACKPPTVLDPKTGRCVCPDGTLPVDGRCQATPPQCQGGARFNPARNRCEPVCQLPLQYDAKRNSCIPVKLPPKCDARTAILRGDACACRYPDMQSNGQGCACPPGRTFVPGVGCAKPLLNCPDGTSFNAKRNRCEPVCQKGEAYDVRQNACTGAPQQPLLKLPGLEPPMPQQKTCKDPKTGAASACP